MFADIGKFLDRHIVKPIDRHIVKPIDRHIVKPIDKAIVRPLRELTDKDYALRHERKEIADLEAKTGRLRPEFYEAQQDMAAAEAAYERASEDFARVHGKGAADLLVQRTPAQGTAPDPRAEMPGVVRAIEDGSRFILKTVSLGLTEAIFNKDEIAAERAFLRKRIGRLREEVERLADAIIRLRRAASRYAAATGQIEAEHAKLGSDATASDVHVARARAAAQHKIIVQLLGEGIAPSVVADMTGIAAQTIAEVARTAALPQHLRRPDDGYSAP